MLRPGATIGILGGGQLGRMLALAAARLGLHCHVYCPEKDSPAFDVVRRVSENRYDDQIALAKFADAIDVITYEFENVPVETATFLAAHKPVWPDPKVLAITQDRLAEKRFVTSLGFSTAPFAEVNNASDLAQALKTIGRPAVLKTRRFGYDGKGQAKITDATDPAAAFREVGSAPSIVEAFVSFEREISVIAARGHDGRIECFDVTENEHGDHILRRSMVPAMVSADVAGEARRMAETIAAAFGYIGVLAVEMFVVATGAGHKVLVNEIAPRVHNSGHWTIDGASVSQFEQHVRAIVGWPLAKPVRHGRIEMFNLIGNEAEDFARWLTTPGASLHLYGKSIWRPGRKMGHVTRVFAEK
ncbi:MAG: 5-(carboxyamino)imidazole ribonucleotide synthase [Xanthobacteraceae bacterium]